MAHSRSLLSPSSPEEVEVLLSRLDSKGTGRVTFDEFMQSWLMASGRMSEDATKPDLTATVPRRSGSVNLGSSSNLRHSRTGSSFFQASPASGSSGRPYTPTSASTSPTGLTPSSPFVVSSVSSPALVGGDPDRPHTPTTPGLPPTRPTRTPSLSGNVISTTTNHRASMMGSPLVRTPQLDPHLATGV